MTDGYYRWYFPGKVPKNRSKQPVFSRAYIRFNSMEEVVQFHQNFNGHVFVDGQGQQTAALVEFAPNQLLPSASRFRDNKAGAIERDSDYLAFVQSLTQPRAANPPDSES
ncbi:regulator of nonsense-mediated decay, partial [Dimargaris cristalligena]